MTQSIATPTNVQPFALAYAPIDPVASLPWSVRPIARFLSRPVWDRRTAGRVSLLCDRAAARFDLEWWAESDARPVWDVIDTAREMIEAFERIPELRPFPPFKQTIAGPPFPFRTHAPIATPGPVVKATRSAETVINEAIEARRTADSSMSRIYTVQAEWKAATDAEKRSVNKLLLSFGLAKVSGRYTSESRFLGFVAECASGVAVDFPVKPAPVPQGWDAIEADDPAPTGGPITSPVATEPPVDVRADLDRHMARLSEIARPTSGPAMVERVTEELAEAVAPYLAAYRAWQDGSAPGTLLEACVIAWKAWDAMGPDGQADFVAWCDAIGYRPFGPDEDPCHDERWDAFVQGCAAGSPVKFEPRPIDPGPDGRPSDLDLAAFVVATMAIGTGPAFTFDRFPGGFSLRALDLAPLVILFTGRGEPWHRTDTATPVPAFLDATPRPAFPDPTPRPRFSDGALTIEVKGRPYGLTCNRDGFTLEKPDGTQYDVTAGILGWSCTCPDATFRRNGLDSLGCIHQRSLRAAGLIPPAPKADDAPVHTSTPEDTTMDDARERIVEAGVEAMLAEYGLAPISGGSEEAPPRGRMSDLHAETAADRADDAERECRRLQGIIDRIAGALGTFELPGAQGTMEVVVLDGDEFLAMHRAIGRARAILSENGDYEGDYEKFTLFSRNPGEETLYCRRACCSIDEAREVAASLGAGDYEVHAQEDEARARFRINPDGTAEELRP